MNQDYKTLIIYVLTLFVVVLLIVLKKQQDHMEKLEDNVAVQADEVTNLEDSTVSEVLDKPIEKKIPMRGIIAIIIDDFGYRNDHISNGFLELPAKA